MQTTRKPFLWSPLPEISMCFAFQVKSVHCNSMPLSYREADMLIVHASMIEM